MLIIGFTWPEPTSTAAGNRMLQLILFFLEENYAIVFASTSIETERSLDLEEMGITKATIRLNDSSFDGFIKNLNPDIVLFDRFLTEEQFGWRVTDTVPDAIRILDTEDLHSLRHAREKAFKEDLKFTVDFWLNSDTTKREIASIYRCDLSLLVSTYEMKLLTETVKIDQALLLYLPFMLESITSTKQKNWPPFEQRKDFICLGNGKHAPNVDAIMWLNTEIWPLVHQQLPTAVISIYGAYLPKDILQMHNPEKGFLVKGWAHDAYEVLSMSRVNLAPLRFGAGIKGKLTDAMLSGTPSITTAIGAEGMHSNLPWSGRVSNTPEDFASNAVALYTNKSSWLEAQRNGAVLINSLFEKEHLSKVLRSKLLELSENRITHRRNNIIGNLLQHQTLRSTKYLSKWIEAKNSKPYIWSFRELFKRIF